MDLKLKVPAHLSSTQLKVLIVEDEEVSRELLKTIVMRQGYEVLTAFNGREAVELYEAEHPDLILMDIMMPEVDGYEATRRIREIAGDTFVPIIFITAMRNEDALAECIRCGGNDFLTKPYSYVIIKAKIDSFIKLSELYNMVSKQRDELMQHQQRLQIEHEIAESVFSNITHSSALNSKRVRYLISPSCIFNGDLLLAAHQPTGQLNVMLGDFTGHGLSAAVGTVPVADIFYSMTQKGLSILDIAMEVNEKLTHIMPKGLFLAVALIEVDDANRKLTVWNGGLPDVLLYRTQSKTISGRFSSQNFPLGVVSSDRVGREMDIAGLDEGDRIYLCSDGVIEARSEEGELFGRERYENVLVKNREPDALFSELKEVLRCYVGDAEQSDDVTLIEITVINFLERKEQLEALPGVRDIAVTGSPSSLSLMVELMPKSLREVDPLPGLMQLVMDVLRLEQCKQDIYIILRELFSNALEHGLLRLDSPLKDAADGFAEYYKSREVRLGQLDEGWIRLGLEHK